jgi:hypothetical protein
MNRLKLLRLDSQISWRLLITSYTDFIFSLFFRSSSNPFISSRYGSNIFCFSEVFLVLDTMVCNIFPEISDSYP